MWYPILLTALTAYLLGNLNGAVCMSTLLEKDDVRNHGSGNAGLTNFLRSYGGWKTLLVVLIDMGKILGHEQDTAWLAEEVEMLTALINDKLWSEEDAFYYDMWRTGLSGVKSIGAYWTLLADIVPAERLPRLIAHLENPAEFKRPHRVPTLSADHPEYNEHGDYWRGSVWAPTNYMVLKGLERVGYHDLAHEIACNTLDNVVKVFLETDTVWENYSSEHVRPGNPAKTDFVIDKTSL